jgi:hypothetical protein
MSETGRGARPALDDYLRDMGARRDGDVATLLAMVKEVLHLEDDEGPSARQRMQSVLDEAEPGDRGAARSPETEEKLIEDILVFVRDPGLRETLRGALGLFARRLRGGDP